MKQRVQKIIAASGYCSRRKAEELIKQGKVKVNGHTIHLGDKADPETDTITIGKHTITIEEHLTIMLNKPSGYLTTRKDLWGRRTVMDLITGIPRNIYPVGRLDRDTRGLLILTSDGDLAQRILHPRNKTTKTYKATLNKPLTREAAKKLREGVMVEGRKVKARLKKIRPRVIEISIHEGRNKIVKKLFNTIGYYVTNLQRTAIGRLQLDIPEGRWRVITENDKQKLLSPLNDEGTTPQQPRPQKEHPHRHASRQTRRSPKQHQER